jgi:hypothetical protein
VKLASYRDVADKTTGLTKREKYGIMQAEMLNDRSTFRVHWSELAKMVSPRRTRWFVDDKNKGDRRNQNIIDTTATLSLRTLKAGMHAGMTSPARPWMKLTILDQDMAKYGPVKSWLHEVTRRMLAVFAKSNIYNVMPMMYGDAGLFASAAVGILEDEESVLRAYSYPIGSFAMALNERGLVNTFYREYPMTVFQLVEKFGVIPGTNDIDWRNLSQTVKTLWDRGQYGTNVPVDWMVTPNMDYNPRMLSGKYKKFASCWYEQGCNEGKFLREQGFDEFPIIAPRWDVTGEDTYGTDCPGMSTLGAIKGLQQAKKEGGKALAKMVSPALQAPVELKQSSISMLPGNITYTADGPGRQGIRPLHEVNVALDKLELWNQQDRDQIKDGFLVNFFLSMLSTERGEMTATEVEQRAQERSLILGPTYERFNDEGFDPLVDRTFAIMDRRGFIPDAPPELHGVSLKVEYTSIMATAQRLSGIVGVDRLLTTVVNAAPVFPDARHYVDIGAAIEEIGDILDINPKILVDPDVAAQSIAQEQQMLQQQHAADVAAKYAGSAKDLSQSPTTGDNALAQLVTGIRGIQ